MTVYSPISLLLDNFLLHRDLEEPDEPLQVRQDWIAYLPFLKGCACANYMRAKISVSGLRCELRVLLSPPNPTDDQSRPLQMPTANDEEDYERQMLGALFA